MIIGEDKWEIDLSRFGTYTLDARDVSLGRPFLFIAGPCALESREVTLEIARHIVRVSVKYDIPMIFKASFDKANRSSSKSARGPGPDGCIELFTEIRSLGLPITTDIHEPWQAAELAPYVDLIQIPALLCRQTDLLVAAARTGKPINVKKGQFMAPWDMANVIDKLRDNGCTNIMLTERGSSFGYNNIIVDMRSLGHLTDLKCLTIFDASHTVQLPGAQRNRSGGERRFIVPMARAAMAFGCDGIFVEVHPEPDKAISDGPSSLYLDQLDKLVAEVLAVRLALKNSSKNN